MPNGLQCISMIHFGTFLKRQLKIMYVSLCVVVHGHIGDTIIEYYDYDYDYDFFFFFL
jgi:hypothetical protein